MIAKRTSVLIVALILLTLNLVSVSATGIVNASPTPASPTHLDEKSPTLPPQSPPTPSKAPTSAAKPQVPATGNTTTFTLPCWSVNATVCVATNATIADNVDVIPNAPYLNASPDDYPPETDSITFDVYSVYNLYTNWGGTSGELLGTDAYLYLNVTDVEWNGIPWFCACDDSTWHANAGSNWAPAATAYLAVNQSVTDMITSAYGAPTSIFSHYRYSLTITATGQSSNGQVANNWPAGAYVSWSVQSVHYTAGIAYINSTQKNFGGMFTYYVQGAWYYGYGACITGQPCYPNNPSPSSTACPTDGYSLAAAAFRCNLVMTINPSGQPTIGTNVLVSLKLNNTAQNYTHAEMQTATLNMEAIYWNGTEYRTATYGFTPFQHWPTVSANVSIPAAYFQQSGDSVVFNLNVYDSYSDELISQNFTEIVSNRTIFPPGTNFSYNANVSTDPGYIGNESSAGLDNGTYPALDVGVGLNTTVTSTNPNVPFEDAWIIFYIKFAANGINQSYVESMVRITNVDWYYNMEPLPTGTNVSFYLKIWDVNQTSLTSHWYHYFVPVISPPSNNEGFFYVEVYDNATNAWVTGANVSIIGQAGAVTIHTQTLAGLAYPNVTGHQFTPEFLAANETYTLIVSWPGFQAQGSAANTTSVRVNFYLTHTMNLTKVLQTGPNWLVKQQKDVIFFSLNVLPAPPAYSSTVPLNYTYLLAALGLIAATALLVPVYTLWRDIRKRAEAEEKRITL